MLEIGSQLQAGRCPTRRSFLRWGSLGLGGIPLARLLSLREAQAASERRDTAVILFWMAGGPSHLDTYDLKPAATAEIRGPFQSLATCVPGLDVCELLPRHAALADRLAIVRSLHHSHSVHDDASHWVQTGYPLLAARDKGQQHPAQGAVVSRLRGANAQRMPPYVCIPEAYNSAKGFYQAGAYLGREFDALNAGGDPSLGNYRPPEFLLPAEINLPRLEGRRGLLESVNQGIERVTSSEAFASLDEMRHRAFDLVAGSQARAAFDLSGEPETLREKYGRHAWGQSALLARRLVEAGVTFVTLNLYEADVDWWDDHYTLEANLRKRLPRFDQAFCTLLEDLHERGLSDRVLVAAFGEFGRAPRIDQHAGRGHWPRAMAAVLSGAGVVGGQVVGATTADGAEPKDRALLPGDLLASIYRVLGIDPAQTLPDRQGRPVRLVEHGEPIRELF